MAQYESHHDDDHYRNFDFDDDDDSRYDSHDVYAHAHDDICDVRGDEIRGRLIQVANMRLEVVLES